MQVIALSHLRWDFVYQRPQHLLSRFAKHGQVWFFEEPVFDSDSPHLHLSRREDGLTVCVPHLAPGTPEDQSFREQRRLLDQLIADQDLREYACWYYTPMAMNFTRHLKPAATVYDCMDELSAFRGAPPGLRAAEAELLERADLVFTGGQSLYEAKKHQHPQVHAFPSSIDSKHFAQARTAQSDPDDQRAIPQPRLGFAGVIDERLDIELLAGAAALRPEWHFVMVGPVVKISDDDLPKAANIHYLGSKNYKDLPAYMSGWDVGMLPFARNESTRFISPTKTPEYLAAGLPVISTSITDVVSPYGDLSLAAIADTPEHFVQACELLLQQKNDPARLRNADQFLSKFSWDITWGNMNDLLRSAMRTPVRRSSAPDSISAQASY
ncbi:MAG: glycosyltransferase family 1 protein [Acidobacteriaceae bacterium]